jgi:hypothetical protein
MLGSHFSRTLGSLNVSSTYPKVCAAIERVPTRCALEFLQRGGLRGMADLVTEAQVGGGGCCSGNSGKQTSNWSVCIRSIDAAGQGPGL